MGCWSEGGTSVISVSELFRTPRWDVHECFITDRLAWVPLDTNACSLSTRHPYSKAERKTAAISHPTAVSQAAVMRQGQRVFAWLHFLLRNYVLRVLLLLGMLWTYLSGTDTKLEWGKKKKSWKKNPLLTRWCLLIKQSLQPYNSLWCDAIKHSKYSCSSAVFLIVNSSAPLLSHSPTLPCQYGFWEKKNLRCVVWWSISLN